MTVIDCDIHNYLASKENLRPYLSQRWRRALDLYGLYYQTRGGFYPAQSANAARADAWPPSGGPPGSDLQFMQEQLMGAWGIKIGILNNLDLLNGVRPNLEYCAALAQAINDWQIAEWLDIEPRLRASIIVPYEAPDLAAAEIERRGHDRRFVQVLLPSHSWEPLGRRKYWTMYAAAVAHDLPIAIHPGAGGGVPPTGAGWPSFYAERHIGFAQQFQTQIISLVCEGVFEQFSDLRVVLIEGGYGWLPPLLWRLDQGWRRLRDEVPHLSKPPSTTVRQHFWFTSQPREEPPKPAFFHQLIEHLAMDDRMLFATDYPHWDFDAPDQALPARLSPSFQRNIMAENARKLYGFEETE